MAKKKTDDVQEVALDVPAAIEAPEAVMASLGETVEPVTSEPRREMLPNGIVAIHW